MTTDPPENFARPRAAAGVLFFDGRDRVLMVIPSYKDYRDIPGGYIEHGETPRQAAAREVREELGIELPIGRLLVTDWAPNPKEGDKQLFIFEGGVIDQVHRDKIQLAPQELTGYEFHDISTIHEATIPRLARRIVQAAEARSESGTRYLEHGEHITG
ncbi:8-oxo-dGTP pyrophosphatase MutT (NUDIX family) [Nocardiopsis mwathae]|uniref:8-oxo-dGTP pyrophosphatase MutT (NUDIX family) n=1 Tax=Nocardiopsis mwathae TaxID=1472723 RepID=A0A7W9YMF0_9ACTN|nr:8-oxo-dGTP pyrophosphatase MutT (NUDIX family) [Nocardiopsis mwathae]